ncbi:uncharacterized protein DEA37_0008124 [Paragonimus westermani]|uniref:Uncharacterized protein n=1 Tax=Paragonimus westermani TaxID=34504 RepID=A0A5J4NY98_9TREM|nr:uncharacterized protein DEA37_0008124 [Paragonimus westermani]
MAYSYRGRLDKDGPIKSTFGESIRQLAKSYYPYIYSDNRNISKPVVDLQSAFEICSESLEEYDRVSGEMTSLSYSIYGLEQALYRALTELTIIREEVCDLMSALRASEKFNLRLLDQLSALDETIQSGVDSGKSVLSASKLPLNSAGMAPEHYMIPRVTREMLENIIDQGKPGAYSTLGADSLLREKISPDYARLTWLVQIQRDLANRHAEFSFLVISLWSEQVRDNFHLSSRKNGCFPASPKTSYDRRGRPSSDEDNLLRMASAAKIEELPSVVQTIQARVFELGGLIVDELNRLRSAFEETKMQHRSLNVELSERRRQLIDSLLATHSAVQTLLDLDERNDALVGKLVKTRPLFADLYRIVQSETLSDEIRTAGPVQGLADVLGPQNWKIFVDHLAKLRVNTTKNANEVD